MGTILLLVVSLLSENHWVRASPCRAFYSAETLPNSKTLSRALLSKESNK
jgi:hypothetical protein